MNITAKNRLFLIPFLLLFTYTSLLAQTKDTKQKRNITWTGTKSFFINETDSVHYLSFDGASYIKNIPCFSEKIKLFDYNNYSVEITDASYEECTAEEIKYLDNSLFKKNIEVSSSVNFEKKSPYLCISFFPFRINQSTGKTEKLISFNLNIHKIPNSSTLNDKKKIYTNSSVLASGNWYKIAVNQSGIYILTYNDLVSLGINIGSIDPRTIKIYGNGGGILPENNSSFRYDDLVENPIFIYGESDGSFDLNDYILFYGDAPVQWNYNTIDNKFHHQTNYYNEVTTYFLTSGSNNGKRISLQSSSSLTANKFITNFNDYACHEKDSFNLVSSGKEWYGEPFDIQTSYSFSFNFPNIDNTTVANIQTDIASKYTSSNYYSVEYSGNSYTSIISGVSGEYVYAATKTESANFYPSGDNINVTIKKTTSGAIGWLNYIELNVMRHLTFSGSQLIFRNASSVGTGNISEFTIGNASPDLKIWDITNPINAVEQQYTLSGSNAQFKIATDTLKEFIAFNGAFYLKPIIIGKIENQNLHALGQVNYIIVTHPDFILEANRLASFHSDNNGLTSVVVTPAQIYNEFSSGNQDVSAIRDFVKMFYDRASGEDESPKYLLLFGDASYDYKNKITDNTNYIPTFESTFAISYSDSYATDDFFGFLDYNEGSYVNSLLDIGIGRFPVKTEAEASTMVDKVTEYYKIYDPGTSSEECTSYSSYNPGDWKNTICFVADDEENNMFLNYSENYSNYIDTTYNNYNIDKIYSDAYIQETGSGGQRYPDVNDAINKRVEKGALIINYVGHGGEVGWALERILQTSDIQNWKNIHNLPLFITATCEFSRFDDPKRTSAGEMVILNSQGGGIALLTTSRVAYANSNDALNRQFYKNAFKKINGEYSTLGDLIMISKNYNGSYVDTQIKNFILLGDPALTLAYPGNKVITTQVNQHDTMTVIDTLKALSKVTISGIIADNTGQKLTNFNGMVYPTVFDKKSAIKTLGNDASSNVTTFLVQKGILYKGKVSVTNGNFTFSFIVPKDIAYNYGEGRISYYASNGAIDANGYYENPFFIIGGSDTNSVKDNAGPEIKLYLNDSNFVNGGLTNGNPFILAYLKDTNGINTVGNGIGHDIVAIVDANSSDPIILNDYYEADLNSYQKGSIRYPLDDLSNGTHTLNLKVWDIYNNSSEASIEFVVSPSADLALYHVLNYPNPFTTSTDFYFEHNYPCCNLDVQIQIFTVSGRLIKTIHQEVLTNGYRAEPITWDGLDDYGDVIGKGVYIYKLKIRNSDNKTAEKTEKLVILR
ncbi:MAG TPA: type IX secretion system sortase PorU [Bacteroidales bacterium]|nr:type IX secretion system sortase PorU [Bacteroidales bacterium]HPS16966.1 type IX secretion system sortase PorU [Bacteroidales bacterium]